MKTFLLAFLAVVACVATYDVNVLSDEDPSEFIDRGGVPIDSHGLILNKQVKKGIKNIMKQLPCGWPAYGIPPLAPYTNANMEVRMAKSVVDSMLQMIKFRFDGLDAMEIKKLKVSYTFSKKVKFHFKFPELRATAYKFNTDTMIDLLNEMGVSVRYEGSGPMEFMLHDLSIEGQFKYKMPFIFGSIKIYNFNAVVTLGGVTSNIGGILGNGGINKLINDKIAAAIPAYINGNQKEISDSIEAAFVPTVNEKLKGNKIWRLFGLLGAEKHECNPKPAPW